ncbi:hypothetical protein [Lacrimispora sp.]|uniref:hypothetical protein n=1 Tax=Lacrimispora sp. TaxID=2719234 RepID=UPI0028AE110F|nr:hypothetical protein [Lacrimispora sp.]
MRKKKYTIIALIVIFLVILVGVGTGYYKRHYGIRFVYCRLVESEDKKIIFKELPGTFDPAEYGLYVYYEASPKVFEEMKTLAASKGVDINGDIFIEFLYNDLVDFKKEKDGVYYKIRKVNDIKKSDYIPHL